MAASPRTVSMIVAGRRRLRRRRHHRAGRALRFRDAAVAVALALAAGEVAGTSTGCASKRRGCSRSQNRTGKSRAAFDHPARITGQKAQPHLYRQYRPPEEPKTRSRTRYPPLAGGAHRAVALARGTLGRGNTLVCPSRPPGWEDRLDGGLRLVILEGVLVVLLPEVTG